MHSSFIYRSLLVASVAVPVTTSVLELLGTPALPPALAEFVFDRDAADLIPTDFAILAFGLPLVVAAAWNYLALYLFRPAARGWAIILTAYALVLMPLLGVQIQTWLSYTGDYVGAVCLGAVLLAGYCEPFSLLFADSRSSTCPLNSRPDG